MSHNIQERDIQTGTEMAWHKRTSMVEDIDRSNCGILYGMAIADTYYKHNEQYIQANGRQIYALDDNLPVGRPVGADYKLIPNSDIWEAVESGLAGTKHKMVSCGTVNNRSLGFISVKVSDDFIAASRETQSVMNVLWGHGGNSAVVARSGFTVVVCQNTYTAAMSEHSDFKLSFRHTAKTNILDLGRAIDAHMGVEAEFKRAMNELAATSCNEDKAHAIYCGFLCKSEEGPDTARGASRMMNKAEKMTNLFQSGAGNEGRTMADVFNGATDFYTHSSAKGKSDWNQFVTSEFGISRIRKNEFYNMLTDEAALNQTIARGERAMEQVLN